MAVTSSCQPLAWNESWVSHSLSTAVCSNSSKGTQNTGLHFILENRFTLGIKNTDRSFTSQSVKNGFFAVTKIKLVIWREEVKKLLTVGIILKIKSESSRIHRRNWVDRMNMTKEDLLYWLSQYCLVSPIGIIFTLERLRTNSCLFTRLHPSDFPG